MPTTYPPGRKCRNCGKELGPRQRSCCSRDCVLAVAHKANPSTPAEIEERLPTDDEIWEQRGLMTWAAWSRECGLSGTAVSNNLAKRGWKKVPKKTTIVQAPCKECGTPTAVEELTRNRVCARCNTPRVLTPTQQLIKREMERRLPGGDRWHLMWKTDRPYTGTATQRFKAKLAA